MKIAVCLYGQPRTWAYTHEWIKEQYRGLDVDYFCSMKTFNTSPTQPDPEVISWDELGALTHAFDPRRSSFAHPNPPHTSASAPAFKALFDANALRQQYESDTGTEYDYVVLQRYDALTGELRDGTVHPAGLTQFIPELAWDGIAVGSIAHNRIGNEAWHMGMSDWALLGTSFAIDTLCAMLLNRFSLIGNSEQLHDVFGMLAHTGLHDICMKNRLNVTVVDLHETLIRPVACDILDPDLKPAEKIIEIQTYWDQINTYLYKADQ